MQKIPKKYYFMQKPNLEDQTNLLCSENNRNHAFWFGSLRALVDQDGAESELDQSRISGSDASTTDHVGILK